MEIGRLVEWIKFSPRHLLSLFTDFVLFAPEKWLAVFGIVGFVAHYRPYFGVALLLSTALLLSAAPTTPTKRLDGVERTGGAGRAATAFCVPRRARFKVRVRLVF